MVLVSKKLLHYLQDATTSDGDNNKRCKCSVIETIKLTCLLMLQKINSITYITLPRVIAEVKMFKCELQLCMPKLL